MRATIQANEISGNRSEFDVIFDLDESEIENSDKEFFNELIHNKLADLHQKTSQYLAEVIDLSKPAFEGGLILSEVSISKLTESESLPNVRMDSHRVEVTSYFENDGDNFWKVLFTACMFSSLGQSDSLLMSPYELRREES